MSTSMKILHGIPASLTMKSTPIGLQVLKILLNNSIMTCPMTDMVTWLITTATRFLSRAEIEVNVTESNADELVGSVVEYNIDGEIFHRDLSSDEEDLDWGDWEEETNALYHGWNVEGRRMSKRNAGKPPP